MRMLPCQLPIGIAKPSSFVHCTTGCGFPLAVHLSRMLLPSCTVITLLAFSDVVSFVIPKISVLQHTRRKIFFYNKKI